MLDAWAASPARFREDANAEEELALGGYRDRLVVELAQNAVDAASRAGVPCRLLLRLEQGTLVAANTGAPLDAAGVAALSTLRASAKRDDDAVGRFGLGFAAVLPASDEPRIGSRATGGVGWSRGTAYALAAGVPALAEEVARRGEEGVPVLRLPHPAEVAVPEGYDTAVELPLLSADVVRAQLAALGQELLVALPGLAEVVVELGGARRVLRSEPVEGGLLVTEDGAATRWTLVRRVLDAGPELLADRPLEERRRTRRAVVWALPAPPRQLPGVVLAPTPTDEPLGLPALLVADLPLEPTRRRTAPGPLRDAVARVAGEAYAALLERLAATEPRAALPLLPVPAGVGEVDALVREAAYAALRTAAVVPLAAGGVVRPTAAVLVDAPAPALPLLGDLLDGVADGAVAPWAALVERLGARVLPLADAVDALPTRGRHDWPALYSALATAPAEELGGLPVPLADGRVVRGARGCLLLDAAAEPVARLGLRVVDAAAAHPLLERLGARRLAVADLLASDELAEAVLAAQDTDDEAEVRAVADAVLALVAAAAPVTQPPWLRDLLLPDDEGEPTPAGELCLPGTAFAAVVDEEVLVPVDPALVERWGADVLAAAGVVRGPVVEVLRDVVLDEDSVPGWLLPWVEEVAPPGLPALAPELPVVRDLDAVRSDAWPAALDLLAGEPDVRRAVLDRVRLVLADGGTAEVASPAAVELRARARLAGRPLPSYATAGGVLGALWDPLPVPVEPALAAALGVRTSLDEVLESAPADLLDRWGDPARALDRAQLAEVLRALAEHAPQVGPPARVRVADGTGTRVVAADDAVVLDAPDLLPLLADVPVLVVPPGLAPALADVLDLPLASEELDLPDPSAGVERATPDAVRALLPAAPPTWVEHEQLVVRGVELDWRVVDGRVHAATTTGLADGASWVAGQWARRHLVAAVLTGELDLGAALTDLDLSP
ncbi:hypothetical protein EV189_2955 [Motilibacter rhizosphaerae]|uniref:Molecular chaperone Hsp90 n=1 Tax=Motilibacter rhizosphaerae TaxID=598652 RepID=A0A4Q7NQB2_9ACTN|nr:hypothetical protein [Motilibacter rhizosphaerae]RZS87524.1 hypothetical protein EV189_2955 [Motilibacter rhizosphaerae]